MIDITLYLLFASLAMSITGRVALDGRGLGGRFRLLPLDTICGSACISLWSLELDDEDDDDC